MKNDILKQIRSCRKKLNISIKKNGLNSSETRRISDKMDTLISRYYDSIEIIKFPPCSCMNVFYKDSYHIIKKMTEEFEKFPSVAQWNQYAKKYDYLSSASIEYISKLNWKYLRIKVEREINEKI